MNLNKYFDATIDIIDKKLRGYLSGGGKSQQKTIYKSMNYSVFSGGKRIRPIILMEAAKVCGGRAKDALTAACAVELVHTYSLVHDDLPSMDDDDYRRGRPTSHKVFGEAVAILTGDALLTLAFNIISKDLEPKIACNVISELSDAIGAGGMVGGQVIDIEFTNMPKNQKILQKINYLKTARLFEAAAKIGAIVSYTNKREIRAMAGYGASLGLAFQIVDDILDKEGYAKIAGVDGAREDSIYLIEKVKNDLKVFGARASRLCDIADFILNRTK